MSEFWSGGNFELPSLNHPWLRADALIETLKTIDGNAYFLNRHLARLSRSISELKYIGGDIAQIAAMVLEMAKNDKFSRGRLRITYFSNGDYLITHHAIDIDQTATYRLGIAPYPRYSKGFLAGHKTMAYTEASFGQRIADEHGYEDLLYLNEREEIVETGFANLLIEIDGKLVTPPVNSGALPGIVRGVLLDWFPVISEREIHRVELGSVSGLYLLSSIREIHPINSVIDGDSEFIFTDSAEVKALRAEFQERSDSDPNS